MRATIPVTRPKPLSPRDYGPRIVLLPDGTAVDAPHAIRLYSILLIGGHIYYVTQWADRKVGRRWREVALAYPRDVVLLDAPRPSRPAPRQEVLPL